MGGKEGCFRRGSTSCLVTLGKRLGKRHIASRLYINISETKLTYWAYWVAASTATQFLSARNHEL